MPKYLIVNQTMIENNESDCPLVKEFDQPQPPKDDAIDAAIRVYINDSWMDDADFDGAEFLTVKVIDQRTVDMAPSLIKTETLGSLT